MNKFKFYFIALCALFALFSCNKSDDITYTPLRFYSDQAETDNKLIELFLNTYHADFIDHPGQQDDQDVVFTKITPENGLTPIMASPLLKTKEVLFNLYTYKVYYLQSREGDPSKEAPTRVDQALVSFDGSYLYGNNPTDPGAQYQRFQYEQFPTNFLALNTTVTGWQEIIPLFKPGVMEAVSGPNPAVYNDFGAGVMFLPSALGYYDAEKTNASGVTTIPSYSPLIFTFKLYDMKRADQDGDGILSVDEDLNHDGDFTNDDTDGDGVQDYLDADDDGDGFLTKYEIKYVNPLDPSHTVYYYPFNGAAVDDPSTPYFDESRGAPSCGDDYTTPTRLRKYLDPTCPVRAN